MRSYLQLNRLESFFFVASLFSWLLFVIGKGMTAHLVERLSFSHALFWVATGIALSPFLCYRLANLKISAEKLFPKDVKSYFLALCGLIPFELLFFHQKSPGDTPLPNFFLMAPFLYWILSLIFFSNRKDLIAFRLFLVVIGLGFIVLTSKGLGVPVLASLCLVILALIVFKTGVSCLQVLFVGAIFQLIIAIVFSFFYWQVDGNISVQGIYGAVGGGTLMGLSMLTFMLGHQFFRVKQSLVSLSTCLLADIIIPPIGYEGYYPILMIALLLFLSSKLVRVAMREPQARNLSFSLQKDQHR